MTTIRINFVESDGAAVPVYGNRRDVRAEQTAARKAAAAARDIKRYRESDADGVAYLLTLVPTDQ